MQPVIFWFRRDLRLADNIALSRAADSGRPIIPVYIVDSQDVGGASRWWLHHSLAGLDKALREDLYRYRLATCFSCEQFNHKSRRCGKCGCFMAAKARIAGNPRMLCPLHLWQR